MMTRDEAAALGSCTLKKKEGGLKAAVEMMIMIKLSIEKKHHQRDVGGCTITKKSDSVFFCVFFLFSFWLVHRNKRDFVFFSPAPLPSSPQTAPLENGAMQTITTGSSTEFRLLSNLFEIKTTMKQ